jgi:hypothetical protein
MAYAQPPAGKATITVLPSSRVMRSQVGPLAWVVLEELALWAEPDMEELAIEASVRDLAASLAVGKDAVATALARLIALDLVRYETRRRAGRYAGSVYILDVDACRRAGLVCNDVRVTAGPCPVMPCPDEPVTAQRVPSSPDMGKTTEPDPAPLSPPERRRDASSQSSLFDLADQPDPSRNAESPAPTSSTDPIPANRNPLPPTSPPFPLPPSNQPDALAPGVRQGRGKVAGNGGGEPSALNGNLNAENEPSC